MKKNIILIFVLMAFASLSCQKWDAGVSEPKVDITVTPANPKVGDTVTVSINTDAKYLSIFTGDEGHNYDYSQVKVQIEKGDAAFKDSVYARKISVPGSKWIRNMADYASVEDLKKDFEFFGAVENIELGDFERPSISQVDMSQKRVLKFSITDRNVVSGIAFHPNVHLYNWDITYEMRLVPCDEDYEARFNGRINREVHALWNMTLKSLNDGSETVSSGDTWNGSGPWCWDYYFYVYQTLEPCFPPRNEGSFNEFYSLRDRVKSQNEYGFYHPEEYVASELKIGFGWPRQPWENGDAYVVDEKGFPANLSNYHGFQGDVYIAYIQWGQDAYADYDRGVSLGSEYTGYGLTTEYKYVYGEAGDYEIVVLGTNLSRKEFSGDGYKTERTSYDSEYLKYRTIAKKKISVSE